MSGRWQFWIDRGGTFTDVVARRPDGILVTHKLLSEPVRGDGEAGGGYQDPAIAAIRHLLGVADGQPIPGYRIEAVRLGTTVATNALLERKGEPTVLVITRGFRDALRIAYQNRPRLFDRQIVLPELLYSRVIEARERVAADGEVLVPLDEQGNGRFARSLFERACACRDVRVVRLGEQATAADLTTVTAADVESAYRELAVPGQG